MTGAIDGSSEQATVDKILHPPGVSPEKSALITRVGRGIGNSDDLPEVIDPESNTAVVTWQRAEVFNAFPYRPEESMLSSRYRGITDDLPLVIDRLGSAKIAAQRANVGCALLFRPEERMYRDVIWRKGITHDLPEVIDSESLASTPLSLESPYSATRERN